jgi:hypothetical protein
MLVRKYLERGAATTTTSTITVWDQDLPQDIIILTILMFSMPLALAQLRLNRQRQNSLRHIRKSGIQVHSRSTIHCQVVTKHTIDHHPQSPMAIQRKIPLNTLLHMHCTALGQGQGQGHIPLQASIPHIQVNRYSPNRHIGQTLIRNMTLPLSRSPIPIHTTMQIILLGHRHPRSEPRHR